MQRIRGWLFLGLLTILFVGSVFTFPWKERGEFYRESGGGFNGMVATLMDTARSFVDILNDHIAGHDLFVQLYGGVQRAAGVDVVADTWADNSVYRLKDGSVTFILKAPEPFDAQTLDRIRTLGETADACGARKLFVVIPQKVCSRQESFASRGVYDGSDDIDAYRKGVFADLDYDVLDLHDAIHEAGMDHLSLYFRTDHHWTYPVGLWAAGRIAQALSMDASLYGADRYETESHPHVFLGSEGKRVGTLYSGVDDLDIPIPSFDTSYELDIPGREIRKTGSFAETMLFREELKRDYFHATPYRVLLKGDHDLLTIRNRNLPDGPRVLMLKDSFADCVAPYFAASCGELTLIDTRYYTGSVIDYVRENPVDVLLIAQSTRAGNSTFTY